MNPTSTTRTPPEPDFEQRVRRLLDAAAEHDPVDLDDLRRRVAGPPRASGRHAVAPWLAVAAAACVAVAGAAIATGAFPEASTTAPTRSVLVPAGGAPATLPLPPASASGSEARSMPSPMTRQPSGGSAPLLSGTVTLPPRQRTADHAAPDSGWVVQGRVTGLGRVHIGGRSHNVLLVAGSLSRDGGAPALCELMLRPEQSVDAVARQAVRYEACWAAPPPGKLRGDLGVTSAGFGTPVEEWAAWVVPTIVTSPRVARVDMTIAGTTFTLQQRFLEKGWAGAVFYGWLPNARPGTAAYPSRITYYDPAGAVLGSETIG